MNRLAVWLVAVGILVAVALTVYLWPDNSAEPGTVVAGTVTEVESEEVIYLPESRIYVVSTDEGFFALGDDSRHVGDRVLFCSLDSTFFSPAHGERFDLQGRYLAGPAQGDMARFPVTVESGLVVVDMSDDPQLWPRSDTGITPQGPTLCSASGMEDPPGFYESDPA